MPLNDKQREQLWDVMYHAFLEMRTLGWGPG